MANSKSSRMRAIGIEQFNEVLQTDADQVFSGKGRFKVKHGKKYFVVLSADEWKAEQETLHVLQNTDLVRQIAKSLAAQTERHQQKRAA